MDDDFDEFLRARRARAGRMRRMWIVVLGIACVALAVSNVLLAMRVTELRTQTAQQPPAPSASIPARSDEPPPDIDVPTTMESQTPEPSRAGGAPSRPRSAELPPRTAGRPIAPAPRVSAAPPSAPAAPAATQPADVTPTWMLATYGRAEAESRARAALDFYDAQSPEGQYWRRVLAEIVTTR